MARMLVLKRGDTFLVVNRAGEVRRGGSGEEGFFFHGTRHVSKYRLRINGHRPLLLSSSVASNNLQLMVDLTNPDVFDDNGRLLIAYGSLHIARTIFVDDGHLFERLRMTSYAEAPVAVKLELEFDADFSDIFEVRGTPRSKRGQRSPWEAADSAARIAYRGLDGIERRSLFQFQPAPTSIDGHSARFGMHLQRHDTVTLDTHIQAEQGKVAAAAGTVSYSASLQVAQDLLKRDEQRECRVETSNEMFNEWLNRSRADLRMLMTPTPHGPYPYAGVPWFSTPFGRDGLWTALQTLWLDPSIGRGVLKFLSAHQATEIDPKADAEPGKILHEMRDGEMAILGEVPFRCYYGSVDSTSLYLMLAARYYRTTGDRQFIESIWPNLISAVDWLRQYGDMDGDGFIEYRTRAADGLVQQGWKDSHDAVFHQDGSAAEGPIALCEVQAYTFAALSGMAELADALGDIHASRWRAAAEQMKARFDAEFWCDELMMYALALDANKRQCRVKSSNAGQCLYTGIVNPERVSPLVRQLMSPQLFSGWGVRTLATDEQRYNPMSYHNGSIWPHDNAVIAEGLALVGCKAEAAQLLAALFDVSLFMDLSRLPELFCGFTRQPGLAPTRYPVACSPQAWASGSAFSLLRAVIGLEVDGVAGRVTLRHPVLPPFVQEVRILNLRVAERQVDLKLVRYADDVGLTIMGSSNIELVIVK